MRPVFPSSSLAAALALVALLWPLPAWAHGDMAGMIIGVGILFLAPVGGGVGLLLLLATLVVGRSTVASGWNRGFPTVARWISWTCLLGCLVVFVGGLWVDARADTGTKLRSAVVWSLVAGTHLLNLRLNRRR